MNNHVSRELISVAIVQCLSLATAIYATLGMSGAGWAPASVARGVQKPKPAKSMPSTRVESPARPIH
jgi:hypothetical protein